jgi:quercetin dioxygenase-like cupin family protein
MATRPHPESERSLHGPLQSLDLDAVVARLREEKAWQEGKRNAITLRKGEGLNVVLLVMKEGDRLEEHSAPGPITLSVHESRIRFSTADEDVEAEAGTVLACDTGVRHSVEALGDAVCLLTVASERSGATPPPFPFFIIHLQTTAFS